jgi:hypothetical protein
MTFCIFCIRAIWLCIVLVKTHMRCVRVLRNLYWDFLKFIPCCPSYIWIILIFFDRSRFVRLHVCHIWKRERIFFKFFFKSELIDLKVILLLDCFLIFFIVDGWMRGKGIFFKCSHRWRRLRFLKLAPCSHSVFLRCFQTKQFIC